MQKLQLLFSNKTKLGKISKEIRLINSKSFYDQKVHEVSRIGFSKEVENYEKARPSYSVESFNVALEAFNLHNLINKNEKVNVLDLAAGTGKFTRLLASRENLNTYAIEPNEEMRKSLQTNVKNIPIFDGTASNIPFKDGFFKVVFVAQAFHWFANIESLREIHRVLQPRSDCKSGLLLIWNMEDREAEPFIAELRDLYEFYDADAPQYRKNEWKNVFNSKEAKALFSDLNTRFVKNSEIYLPVSHIWSRILSKSYIARLDKSEKNALKKKVDDIIEKYKKFQVQRPDFDELCMHFPYNTEITWCFNK